jgi:diguanylate cyclase (GGDEF)-like protein/PAS domain S-box-containing protein
MLRVLNCLTEEHVWQFVLPASAMCLVVSLAAISLLRRARITGGHIRLVWTGIAGTVFGCGIWGTHFIAILGYRPGITIAYGIELTVASLIVAVAVSSAGFWLAVNGPARWRSYLGGAVVGGGIACMHYLGISALQLPGHVRWSIDLVLASILFALMFATAALIVAQRRHDTPGTVAGAVLLTLAILSHHFTGMAAVEVVPDPTVVSSLAALSSSALAMSIAVTAAAVLGMTLLGAFADIRLRERTHWLHLAIGSMSQGFLLFDRDERLVAANDRYIQIYGLSPAVVKPGITLRELIQYHSASGALSSNAEQYRAELLAARRQRRPISNVLELKNGRSILVSDQLTPDGGWLALHEDITERRQAESALRAAHVAARQAHARLLDAFDLVPEGLVLLDAEDRYVLWNRRFAEIYPVSQGVRFEDNVRAGLAAGLHPDAAGREEAWLAERMERHRRSQDAHEQRVSGDRWVRVEERRTADGGSIGMRIDITDLKRREASFRLLFDGNPAPMWVYDRETLGFIAVNDAAVEKYGYSRDQFLAMTVLDLRPHEEREAIRAVIQANEGGWVQGTVRRHFKADGTRLDVALYGRSLRHEGRDAALVTAIDITERTRAEDDVRRTREFLNTLIEHVPAMIIVKDANDLRYVLVNRAAEEYFGLPRETIIGSTAAEIFSESSAAAIAEYDRQLLTTLQTRQIREYSLLLPGNESRSVTSTRLAILSDDGKPRYLVTVIQDVTEAKQAEARIQHMAHIAHHDPLTGLPNRAAFNARLAAAFETASAAAGFALLCIDLDHFKEVNDVFGHAFGDTVLLEIARRLWAAAEGDFIGRFGGDEFIAIAPADAAGSLAERMLTAVPGALDIEGQRVRIGLSIGIAVCPADATDATTLLGHADAALYRAKASGRGGACFFDAEKDKRWREIIIRPLPPEPYVDVPDAGAG